MNRYFLYVIFFLCIFSPSISYAHFSINCRAKHTLHHDNLIIIAFYHFILTKDRGIISVNGKLSYEGVETIIGRSVYFDYSIVGEDNYVSKTFKVIKIPSDNTPDEIMEQHYPLFFTQKNKTLLINIKKNSLDSYLISFVRTPLFYCAKS